MKPQSSLRHTLAPAPHSLLPAAALLSMCTVANFASAQQPAGAASGPPSSDTLEEITVTAQFRTENLQITPIAITAITGAMLEERSQTTLADVTAQAPNVILQPSGAGGGDSMRAQIRGVGQTDFDPAVDPGVGVYIDDVFFATLTGSDFALLDLDRVEILRGPQGTLAGMNSLGGSVKLYSQKPTGSNDGYVEATYGSLNRVDVRASADFALVPDQLFMRLSGVSRRQDGYVRLFDYACTHPTDPYVVAGKIPRGNSTTDCSTGSEGGIDYDAIRATFRWTPTSNFEVNWISDATDQNNGTTPNTLLSVYPSFFSKAVLTYQGFPYDSRYVPTNPFANYANFLDSGTTWSAANASGAPGTPNGPFQASEENKMTAYGSSLTADWKIADALSLKSITAYRHYVSQWGDDNDDSPVNLVLEEARFTHRQFSQELRLSGSGGSFLDYTVGGIFFDQNTIYASREDSPFAGFGTPTEPTFDFLQNDPTHLKTKAGFANSAWHLFPGLTLNAGIRYTKEDKTYTFERLQIDGVTPYYPLSNPANPLNGKVGAYDGSHIDYRADIDYQWTPSVMTYVSWSTGFKGGGITPRPYYPQQVTGFGQETLKSSEAGLKSQWFDNRLRANLAVFYEDYYGYQASANLPQFCVDTSGKPLPFPYNTPCGEYINAANAVGKGVEAEFEYRPIDHLTIDASWSYLDFKFIKSLIASVPTGEGAPDVGKNKGSVGVQYEASLMDYGTVTPRLDVSYTPGSCGDLACDALVQNDSYTLVNGRLTYWSPKHVWSVSGQLTNLTNRIYYITKTNTGIGYLDGQIGMPREWAITVRRQF